MIGQHSKIDELRRRLDRKRAEYDEAKRVQSLVMADNWPDIRFWIEQQMAKCGDAVASVQEPLQIATLMGGWNALRQLLTVAEMCRDLSGLEVNLKTLQEDFQNRALGGK